jgi:hypothetical protein
MTNPQQQIQIPSGFACVTTYGSITQQTAQCLLNARSFTEKQGLHNIQWTMIPGTLVEKARNEAVRQMLRAGHGWLLFIDGDCTFDEQAIIQILQSAYGEMPNADAMGAWCPLRGDLALPTIDTGTGTWESHYPGSGIMPVMRTGGAFLLVKRHVFEALKDPWFRMRVPARPIDFLGEVDNWLRIKFDGKNPFRDYGDYWTRAEKAATDDPSIVVENFVPVEVGEDSGFADRAKLAGFNLFVNTNIACGHVDQKVLVWSDHKKAMEEAAKWQRLASGLLA